MAPYGKWTLGDATVGVQASACPQLSFRRAKCRRKRGDKLKFELQQMRLRSVFFMGGTVSGTTLRGLKTIAHTFPRTCARGYNSPITEHRSLWFTPLPALSRCRLCRAGRPEVRTTPASRRPSLLSLPARWPAACSVWRELLESNPGAPGDAESLPEPV